MRKEGLQETVDAARPRTRRQVFWRCFWALSIFLVLLFLASTFAQAWSMTHYAPTHSRTTYLANLTLSGKVHTLLFGPTIRRQVNVKTPADIGLPFCDHAFPGLRRLDLGGLAGPGINN